MKPERQFGPEQSSLLVQRLQTLACNFIINYSPGGPLITAGSGSGVTAGQNYELIGVVSWGIGCAEAEYPGVYARVTEQLDWIRSTTANGWSTCPRE